MISGTEETPNVDYYVYTDGACSKNGMNNASAGIGIYFGENDSRNVSQQIKGKQTNNVAELAAIVQAYSIIKDDAESGKNITIVSDSKYAISCATTYGKKCQKNDWDVDIPNKELVRCAYELYECHPNIRFNYIQAHTQHTDIHSIGNQNADRLATASIGGQVAPPISGSDDNHIYLNVPFMEKEKIKKLGGKWNPSKKQWYINTNNKSKGKILSMFEIAT